MPFDRKKFNEDPKHEEERLQMDAMVEDSINRVAARRAQAQGKPIPQGKNFFESLLDNLFAPAPAGEENIFDRFFGPKK